MRIGFLFNISGAYSGAVINVIAEHAALQIP